MKLWIDDIREAPVGYTHIATNYQEAIDIINLYSEQLTHLSFDNDLGELSVDKDGNELSGYEIASYIEEKFMMREMRFESLIGLQAHSSNYWGRKRIYAAMMYIACNHDNNIKVYESPYENMVYCDAFGFKI